jgi:chromosome segregation ATPase
VQDQVSFLQPRRPTRHSHSSAEQKLFRYLNKQAIVLKSPQLSTLAMKMKEDHFKKVRTMIKDLVAKLEADAEAEQTQKGWCDDEMEKATSKRDENIGAIEGDTAAITDAKASIDQLTQEIKELETEIANLHKALNEATKLRNTESEENKKTIDDATAGLGAVNAAIKVLKDFYEDSSLVQVKTVREPIEGAPETGLQGEGFKGNQAQSKGIIGLMEVIASDFEGTISETTDTEQEMADQYTSYKEDTDGTISEKKSLMRSKKEEVRTTKSDLMDYQDNLKEHKGLKEEALSELSKLTPTCVGTGVSYEERVARREQEIQSLKNSYKILDDMGASR